MIKTNLPVILLKGIILLPNNEIRLEFDNDESKNIIYVSEMFHDNKLLVITSLDPYEEEPELEELPKIGVISTITRKIELPNGKTRVIITGTRRANVFEYLNLNRASEILESIVSPVIEEKIEPSEEEAIIKKINKELQECVRNIPTMSNGMLSKLENIKSLSKMTDLVVPYLPLDMKKTHKYLIEISPRKRAEYLLEDLYREEEIYEIEKELDSKVNKEMDDLQKEFILKEKIKAIKQELGDANLKDDEIEEIKEQIKNLKAPKKIKERLEKELKRYETLAPMSPEINIVKNYIDWLLELPWEEETKDNEDLKSIRQELDKSHYGLEEAKIRIIEYLAVKKMTKELKSPIICLVGPPGVGKTSLAYSISKAIKRNFVKISVGGVNDEAEIKGHRRTYLGSQPGRIITGMKKAKSVNPVFLIDEIDKLTKDIKGDPASALLEILDPEQNKYFSDNYIEEEYDLSRVMFIATANYIDEIPEALKDRLEIINLSGYTEYEKLDIAKKHLIKRICKEHGIKKELIDIEDKIILKIIRSYTKEAGVRELERQLSKIIRKIVTSIVVNNEKMSKINITLKNLEKYLGKEKYHFNSKNNISLVGVVNGLAYTSYGGDTLPIEVNYYKGKGKLTLTGSLGEVMKESALIALSYIKANYKYFGIEYNKIVGNDIHIHVPSGAVPKDGPSAGITLTTALISSLKNKKVDSSIAMTGELTLRGKILPIGGLKEKSIGANRSNIKTILIPYENIVDLDEVPQDVKKKINYVPVKNYREVYKYIFGDENE